MWNVNGKNISMAEGDFGRALPIRCRGTDLTAADKIKFTFKRSMNGTTILEKELAAVDNLITLTFTEAESALFPFGQYVYSVDWYRNGSFMCNLIPVSLFKVVDKA